MSQKPELTFTIPISTTIPVKLPFVDALVKMVDAVRTGDYSQEQKDQAVKGLDMVIKAVKGGHNRHIVGAMNKRIMSANELANAVKDKIIKT